jgi:hypothetical protein
MKTVKVLITLLAFLFIDRGLAQSGSGDAGRNATFSTDVVVHNKTSENQRNLRMASAFNGWLYIANTINDTSNLRGGIYVSFSKDNGVTWKKFVTYVFNNSFYSLTDIVVSGTDTSHLNVFLAGVYRNFPTLNYTVYMDKFDGRNGTLTAGQIFVRSLGSSRVTDISLASDYLFPSSGAVPYSVGLLYSVSGGVKDSLLFSESTDGGNTFSLNQVLNTTKGAFRKVSLAYGRSASIAGSYYAAWEMLGTPLSTLGHIYTSHNYAKSNLGWANPMCLDSLSTGTFNLVRNPCISCQNNNSDNDSANLTSLVTFERAAGGNTKDMDVLGYYNKRSSNGSFWNIFSIAATAENDIQPSSTFDSGKNAFLLTYYDSTNGRLPYCNKTFNMDSPDTWNLITPQYNDQTANLKFAFPHILVNPVLHTAGFAWVAENTSTKNGSILFDSESAGIATGIQTSSVTENNIALPYPNPASDRIQIPVSLQISGDVLLRVLDMQGKEVGAMQIFHMPEGAGNISLGLSQYPSGIYFCHVEAGTLNRTLRFVLSK